MKTPISLVAADVRRLKALGYLGAACEKVRAFLRQRLLFIPALRLARKQTPYENAV